MFISHFFKENTNFIVLEVLKTISRVQVYFENNILKVYTGNSLHFETIHVIHVYIPVFQGEFEF